MWYFSSSDNTHLPRSKKPLPAHMKSISILLCLLPAALLLSGCDERVTETVPPPAPPSQSNSSSSSSTNSSSTSTNSVTDPAVIEQAEWDSIRWLTSKGPSCKGAVRVMTLSGNITDDGRLVRFTWDHYPWRGGDNELMHFFVWDGLRWVGGKCDWIKDGGQSAKTLSNIHSGYNGHRAPARGSRVAFAWTNEKGTERSNLVVTTWR